ncbi:DUF4202 domain-containing protein [Thalassomonas viridans]|uniref:DUF4202 domain-containing protein n=1 Tax=Thalassomonas viridans TaxID=137584 RepID=A0AAE9Z5E5_9GAMM|nr:DUF4202 domain-containing protein [Thalassomonas viridans]WDE06384.1 DUF4202 domain-containing protein [Thalassomonas viridans]
MSRLDSVLSAIDDINNQDPNSVSFDGQTQPKELVYGRQMSRCQQQYWPEASEYLQIAARAQHIKRWFLKRSEFEAGKAGYLAWRKEQGKYHARLTSELMQANGYSEEEITQTAVIIRKERLRHNPDSQALEDIACLVFLQYYFDEFAAKHSEEKIVRILQKTWKKMSVKAQDIALTLNLPEHLAALVEKALAP